ncbi:MAG: hypothetical protein JWN64_432 [Parcubacteria group bacterium]|nr:hypothetical protein [Parcubacteria group bacterium]
MSKQQLAAIILVVIVIGAVGFLAFKNKPSLMDTSGKIQVVASFYPMYFFASQIGGDKVSVTNITPVGAEPHDYEPSTQDVARIEGADVLVLNGSVEAWGDKEKSVLAGSKVMVITAGEGLLSKQITEEGETMSDPHIWLDPILAKQEAHTIAQGLAKADPANASYYAQNEQTLDAKFDQLDGEYKAGLAQCTSKNIVTSHAAFAYLSEHYGLNQVAISGLSPDEEPSSAQLAKVADFARTNKVKYIFFESLVSPKLSQTIATEIGAQTMVLDPIEGISDEDMADGDNYFSVMRSNLQNLKTALECKGGARM